MQTDLEAGPTAQPAISRWHIAKPWQAAELPVIAASDVAPIISGLDLWDCWPLQNEDGSTAQIGGAEFWFFLSAPCFDDPVERHFHARIRLLKRQDGVWFDLGNAMPDGFSPGHAEWAGSCVLDADGKGVTLYFTTAGYRGQGPGFQQRMFASRGTLDASTGPGNWQECTELFRPDGVLFQPADKAEGAPGTIKAFRDPAWFRDPADGQAYVLFTGSAGWSDDPFNGLVGFASETDNGWELGQPLIEAEGVNNELERPHIVMRGGLYYLFWSTQRHTFSPDVEAGPNGLYGAVADSFSGEWKPINGNGLVVANPASEPTQSYSWWVTGEGEVWSFIDYWGMRGRALGDHPELLRSQFGGTPAPRFRLAFDGSSVTLAA